MNFVEEAALHGLIQIASQIGRCNHDTVIKTFHLLEDDVLDAVFGLVNSTFD